MIYKKSFLVTFLCTLVIFLFCGGTFYLSNNYNEIYNIPTLNNSVLDIEDFNIEERNVDYLLNGEWDFYYNQWIVTDKDDSLTGKISLPNHWNDVFKISKNGYASYKIKIDGLKKNTCLSVVLNNFRGSYRAFINDVLVASSGKLSKTNDNYVSGYVDYKNPYRVNDEVSLELVLEIGYNTFGGFYSSPWLTTEKFSSNTSSLSNIIHFITIIMIGALVCLSIILFFVYKGLKNYDYSFVYDFLFGIFLMFNQIFCKDGSLLITRLNLLDYRIINFLSYLFLFSSTLIFLKKDKNIVFLSITSFLYILIGIFSFTKWNIIFVILLMLCLISYLYFKKDKKGLNLITFSLLILINFIELVDCLGFVVFGGECIVSILLFLVLILLTLSIGLKIKQLSKSNFEIKNKLNIEKSKVLSTQMQPHFIFNTLSSIKVLYNEDKQIADKMLSDFSNHLRYQINSLKNEFVTFEEEINNISNYVELFLLRKNYKVEVLYDLEDIDFYLPAFSLQPFVENSLKYSQIEKLKNGQLIISSRRINQQIEITIKDNGCGFDINNISSTSTGINNCKERLKLLLKAKINIDSKINEGTIVKIVFKEDYEKDNNC